MWRFRRIRLIALTVLLVVATVTVVVELRKAAPPEAATSLVEVPLGIAAGLLGGVVAAGVVLLALRWAGLHP